LANADVFGWPVMFLKMVWRLLVTMSQVGDLNESGMAGTVKGI